MVRIFVSIVTLFFCASILKASLLLFCYNVVSPNAPKREWLAPVFFVLLLVAMIGGSWLAEKLAGLFSNNEL
jgi:hypothetical protein